MKKIENKLPWKIISILIILILLSLIYFFNSQPSFISVSMNQTVYGLLEVGNGCSSIDGILVCNLNSSQENYSGKLVEIKGNIGEWGKCPKGSQCPKENALTFKKIDSIKIVDFNEINSSYKKISLIKLPLKYNNFISINESNFICYNYYIQLGNITLAVDNQGHDTISNPDILYSLPVDGGNLVRLYTYPSACTCGNVSSTAEDYFIGSDGNTKLLRNQITKQWISLDCIN